MNDHTNRKPVELDLDALSFVTGGTGGSEKKTIEKYCPNCNAKKEFIIYKGGRLKCPDCVYSTTEM